MSKAIGTNLSTILLDDGQSAAGGTGVGAGFSFSRAILALAPVLVTFLVQLMVWPIIRPFAWFLFSPAVFFSAWIGGRRLGILASVVATLLVWYFFLPPERSFIERSARETVAALTFLGTGVVFSLFHDRLKRAERRVAEAVAADRYQAQMESVFENAAVGIARVAPDGRFLEVNRRLCDIVGYTREELMTKTFGDITHPGDLEADWERARLLLAGELENYSMEKRYYRKDGSIVWINLTASVARKAGGSPDYGIAIVEDITERKLAEAERAKFVALADQSQEFIGMCDLDFVPFYVNPAGQRLVGLDSLAQACSVRVQDYFFPEDQPYITNELFPQVLRDGRAEVEIRFRHFQTGAALWVIYNVFQVRDENGQVVGYATVSRNITERKLAEEALRAREQRYELVLAGAGAAIWDWDVPAKRVVYSPLWRHMRGFYDDEVSDREEEWSSGIHPDDRERVLAAVKAHFEGRTPVFAEEYRVRHKSGRWIWILDRGLALRDLSGRVIRMAGSETDITERKQADQTLRESKERLAGIVSSAMDAIITVDEDQRIVLFNEAAEKMFGCPATEALGQPLDRFIPERFRGAHNEHVRRFGETGGTSRAMGRITALAALRADGAEFPIEAAISSIEVGGRKIYTVIHRDITERKQAEAEREQLAQEQTARAAAEAANRSKDEFLALVSHELRSPLNAILGYTRTLRSGPVDRDSINNITAIVERSAKAQLQIIEDLLDSARIVAGKLRIEPEPVDLVPALQAALDTVRSAAEAKGITLVADFSPLPEEVLGDATRLQQVVWNLLTNAVKFTPEGGRVELRMESDADSVRITVSDTGKGIEPEFMPFVFDRFRQADPSSARRYGGLGLGLSLVKHLVELHGGTITAASEGAGQGSTFTVTLPRRHLEFIAPTPAVAPREARTEGAIMMNRDVSLEGVSVLVVDDQEDDRELLVQALGGYGAQVAAVSSGAEALAFLSNPPGGKRPDALIMDIAMPDEDGYAALKKVRALEAAQGAAADQIPAIALTAYGRSEDRLRALQAGFNMHVAKPVDPAELAVVIASATTNSAWERKRKK
jgi:PAS domain S-box-containing protein